MIFKLVRLRHTSISLVFPSFTSAAMILHSSIWSCGVTIPWRNATDSLSWLVQYVGIVRSIDGEALLKIFNIHIAFVSLQMKRPWPSLEHVREGVSTVLISLSIWLKIMKLAAEFNWEGESLKDYLKSERPAVATIDEEGVFVVLWLECWTSSSANKNSNCPITSTFGLITFGKA